jgi:hypothetical protein
MTPQWTAASGATNQVRTGLFDQQWGPITATGPRSADSSLADSIAQTVVLESATGAAGAIAPRGTSGPTLGADGTTLTLSKPGGTVKGDAMIAQIAVRGGTATTVTAPVGWLLVDARDNGLAIKSLIYERTATSAATEPFTWTFGSNPEATGGMISYGGAATASTAFVDDVWFWNGTTFVDPGPTDPVPSDPCPAEGLQRVFLRVTSKDGRSIEQVEVVKRQP